MSARQGDFGVWQDEGPPGVRAIWQELRAGEWRLARPER
jgi:hypothetical protein